MNKKASATIGVIIFILVLILIFLFIAARGIIKDRIAERNARQINFDKNSVSIQTNSEGNAGINTNIQTDNREEIENNEQIQIITSEFQNKENWEAFDAGNIGGLLTRGYFGAVFDGKYIYYAPCRTKDFHGIALRYDTEENFKSASSWESYDAGNTDGLKTVGYAGAVFDGRYVYYVPFAESTARHARILRFDTQRSFTSSSSWEAFDAQAVNGLSTSGYDGAVFDGRYIYFAPFGYTPFAHAKVLRFDTQADFKSEDSWKVYDAKNTDGLNTKGYYGTILAGDYVYFVPFNDGSEFHGRVLRYNTKEDFESSSSWEAFDASAIGGSLNVGYKGAVFDGKYIYFVPFRDEGKSHGRILRLDTQGDFKSEDSWQVYDAANTEGLDTRGYVGGEFDGRYIYFIPYSYEESTFHSIALRYDTQGNFDSSSSWESFDASNIDGLNTKGYKYSASDGEYIYYVPYNNGKQFSGIALRYKTN